MIFKNAILNKNMNYAFLLFGLVISLAFIQLYQSDTINIDNNVENIKEGFNYNSIQTANASIIDEINSLKDVETDLYNILDIMHSNGTQTPATLNDYITKIQRVNELRVKLYSNLIQNYEIYQNNVIDTSRNAEKLDTAATIATASITPIAILNDERTNNKRYIEVNTYYANRYKYLTDIVKIIIYICIAMLVLSVLANNSLIPEWLYSWCLVILLIIGLYFLGKKILLLLNIDNMNFDRFDWHFKPPK